MRERIFAVLYFTCLYYSMLYLYQVGVVTGRRQRDNELDLIGKKNTDVARMIEHPFLKAANDSKEDCVSVPEAG